MRDVTASRWLTKAVGIGGCIVTCRDGPSADLIVRRRDATHGYLPLEPSQKTDRVAGRFLRVVPSDAEANCSSPHGEKFGTTNPECAAQACRLAFPADCGCRMSADPIGRQRATMTHCRLSCGPLPRSSWYRRWPCAFGWRSSVYSIARCHGSAPWRRFMSFFLRRS